MELAAPDLTQRPPRSSRSRLGGYVYLPRMLDKCRALLAGKNGEYNYACPLDQRLLTFLDLDPEALKTEVATGKGDWELLQWILENAKNKHTPWQVEEWSNYMMRRGPGSDQETLVWYADLVAKLNPHREDITTWADLLDLDDHVTFGGKA
ncbi:MAG: DUF5069 domain-containing protein [Chthoniobacteraceae bacterium]